jgi:ribosome biogenesis ATPase
MAKGAAGASFQVDPQILQRVRCIIEDHDLKRPTEDVVLDHLTRKHREYTRKPQNILRRMVAKAIRLVNSPPKTTTTDDKGDPSGVAGVKRSRPQSIDGQQQQTQDSDSASPTPATDNDAIPATPRAAKSHDSLNSTLRSKYRTKQTPTPPPENTTADSGAATASNTPAVKRVMRRRSAVGNTSGGGGIPGLSKHTIAPSERPAVRFADVGGVESIIQDVRELCEYPLRHPELYAHLGVEPPRGILLHGPPGCGKTLLANAIAGELEVPFFKVAATEMVSGMSGESEEKVRSLFEEAKAAAPSIIFIDEIDAITSKRESTSRGMEKRIVAQLLTSMDSLAFNNWSSSSASTNDEQQDEEDGSGTTASPHKAVIVIGATNYPDALDPALRRAGRFDREIAMGIPDQKARERILLTLTGKMKLEGSFDLVKIARLTPGYVGADLSALAKEAAVIAINRIFGAIEPAAEETSGVQDEDSDDEYGAAFANALAPEAMDGSSDVADVTTEIADVNMSTHPETAPGNSSRGLDVGGAGEHRKSAAEVLGSREQLTTAQMAPLCITMSDFEEATKKVQPSSKREGFATVPAVSWDDIGAMCEVSECRLCCVCLFVLCEILSSMCVYPSVTLATSVMKQFKRAPLCAQ